MDAGSIRINELCKACENGEIETINRLISDGVDVNGVGQTQDMITELVGCHPQIKATPLHYASMQGHSSVIPILVKAGADVNSVKFAFIEEEEFMEKFGQEMPPLAKKLWKVEEFLIPFPVKLPELEELGKSFFKKLLGNTCITPLHWAVKGGHIDCVKELLSAPKIDVNITNDNGNTLVMLANGNYEILKLLRSFCDFPVHTFSKVILCGNSGAGKSTLTQAIRSVYNCNEKVGSLKHRVKNFYKAAEPPKPLTAGIIPYNIQSSYGNMVLYDLAGQPEYYTSNCACIEAISLSSPATFLSLVDISKGQDEITKQINYWSKMISNVCSECKDISEVIVVGTHADKVDKANRQRLCNTIEELAKGQFKNANLAEGLFKNLHFAGFVALDTKAQFSDDMKRFIGLFKESNDTVVQRCPVISPDCHILYAFLQQMLPSEQVITIAHLLCLLQKDPTNVLPTETSKIQPLLMTLSDKGLILFIYNKHSVDSSWVVLNKDLLLRTVAGVLFASDRFIEYRGLASNTGFVPIDLFKEQFSDLNLDTIMLVSFLVQLKLCCLVGATHRIIDDSEIPAELTNNNDNYMLFFPSLVKVEITRCHNIDVKGTFGWLMRTKDPYEFFPNRFLHVMLFTLANEFCSGTEVVCNPALKGINRQCTAIWNTGICFNTAEGMTIFVDMVEQFSCLYVAVSFPGPRLQYKDLPVLQAIRKTHYTYCRNVAVKEFVVDPRHVNALFCKGCVPRSLPHMEISALKDAVMMGQEGARDANGDVVQIDEWFKAERRLPELIGIKLKSNSVSTSEVSSSQLLSELVHQAMPNLEDPPTMPELLSAEKLNIAVKVGARYFTFGVHLLEDKTAAIVEALELEHQKKADRINTAILQQWLQGKGVKPVTWSTLVSVLCKIEM